ncbi:pRiA4b ORF-3-like protein [Aliiroseovarius halocynthiae]|uniref:Plasmid pRiA4b ORF-3 family protein n=1 Tax=Aliiroseovarius halocynthiae TaxID=985055 RepID=A0A545SLC6_9RHOB|nr:plasmid pRiA4b ORF-3 family protein [Aliiroseovarius halocynthiae]TQV65762.1 plasmid pRiA4b ORF-3 family protein [Aliiroseovarius halocynthiae]SMR83527.1 pRiA4b ORF-3-like protein [Aliiroseovarius halocynthiae]
MSAAPEIYQLKVRLLGISPMIWRRVLVPTSTTLRELHGIFQVAMGWEGIHLFIFDVYAVRYGSFELHVANPDVSLQEFELRANERFSYIYDMGDHWEHEIRVEAINPPPKKSYPVCTGGSGVCPPEDCGGPHGYLERRDETESYDAWRDMDIMTGFLEDVVAADAPERPVSDFLSDDVEAAMERMIARKPFVEGKFSRGAVNKRFRAGEHRDLMHQQMW